MKTSLLNLIHIVGFISIFSYSMPMNYLPVSLCTVSQLLLVILGSWKYKLCVNKRILILILYVIAKFVKFCPYNFCHSNYFYKIFGLYIRKLFFCEILRRKLEVIYKGIFKDMYSFLCCFCYTGIWLFIKYTFAL